MENNINTVMDALSKDKDFLIKLVDSKTIDEVKQLFKQKGVEAKDEEIEMMKKVFLTAIDKGGEISDLELSEVIGGLPKDFFSKNWHKIAMGLSALVVAGVAIGVGVKANKTMDRFESTRQNLENQVGALSEKADNLMDDSGKALEDARATLYRANRLMVNAEGGALRFFLKK